MFSFYGWMDALHARAQRHKIRIETRDRQFLAMQNKNTHLTHCADKLPTGHQYTHTKINTTAYSETVEFVFKHFCKQPKNKKLLNMQIIA